MPEPTMSEPTEMELIEQAKQWGDQEAFRGLLDRYFRYVRTIMLRRKCNDDVADELTQAVFCRAFCNIMTFEYRGEGSFKAWLSQMAVFVLIEHFRKRREVGLPEDFDSLAGDSERPDPRKEVLDEALSQLSEGDRDILKRQYWERQTYDEIAQACGLSVGMVKTRLQQAKSRLRVAIDRILRQTEDSAPVDL